MYIFGPFVGIYLVSFKKCGILKKFIIQTHSVTCACSKTVVKKQQVDFTKALLYL